MPADVCLLLVQSLMGDCEATAPSMETTIAPTEQQTIREQPAVNRIPNEAAPTRSNWEPQFGTSEACLQDETQRLLSCLEPVQQRLRFGSMATPQTQPGIATPISNTSKDKLSSEAVAAVLSSDPTTILQSVSTSTSTSASAIANAGPATPVTLQIALPKKLIAIAPTPVPLFSPPIAQRRPASGAQFYRQRELALQSGRLYTRLSPSEYADEWSQANEQPTYQEWISLLTRESQAVAVGQGSNRLEVIVGDSLGMWLPSDTLPRDRLWLNQSISGDTTSGILQRLTSFAGTRPTTIHLLAGVNDLKNGVPEATIASNLQTIVHQLQQQHPDANIVMYSLFPTRRADITNDRVQTLNRYLTAIAEEMAVEYRDVHSQFQDVEGSMRTELTTDGLHLNPQGYDVWRQSILATTLL
ncbi:MAG: GDSL-type esterase/lipase family protein [Cyanobacteria bacterium J06626_18]